ncbi:MAG: hypothetical protein E7162_03000 [Firmicutes bacterium]|nr:hypothetical protein [Bacillota bacterium]
MQIDVNLKAPFSYSWIPIVVLLIVLLLPFIYLLLKKLGVFNLKKNNILNFTAKDINSIKYKYLNKLNDLDKSLNDKKITSRKAYQELSMLIRLFVYELTGLEVQSCTLKDIKKLNIPVLYELIKEYYDPEFSKISKGNIKSSIEKTKEVISRWN